MLRTTIAVTALLLLAGGCKYRDNASPFAHGAHFDPRSDNTQYSGPSGNQGATQQTDTQYGASSGVSGGTQTDTAGAAQASVPQANADAAPTGGATTTGASAGNATNAGSTGAGATTSSH